MTAMALLGGLSGGQGGQQFGGDAGPSTSGNISSGIGDIGGLSFNTGGSGGQFPLVPVLAVGGLVLVGFLIWKRA